MKTRIVALLSLLGLVLSAPLLGGCYADVQPAPVVYRPAPPVAHGYVWVDYYGNRHWR